MAWASSMWGSQPASVHSTKLLNRTLRQICHGHQTQLLGQEGSQSLGAENINLVSLIFTFIEYFKPRGKNKESWVAWLISAILALEIWRKEDQKFKVILSYLASLG